MTHTILELLEPLLGDVLHRIVLPEHLRTLLSHLSTDGSLPPGPEAAPIEGEVQASANDSAGGFAQLDIDPIGPPIAFALRLLGPAGAPTGFQFDLEPVDGLLRLPAECRPAQLHGPADSATLVETPAADQLELRLNGTDPLAIRIEGSDARAAEMSIVALDAAQEGVVTVGVEPPAFLLGSQGFGIHLPRGLIIDSSPTSGPPAPAHRGGRVPPSASPSWRGVALRGAELYLPPGTPLIGAGPIPVDLELGLPTGLYGHTEVHMPASGSRPALDVSVTWDDPAATSLASALPTTIEVRAMWELDRAPGPPAVGAIDLLGGRPLLVTGRFTRVLGTSDLMFGLTVEADGDDGLLAVEGSGTAGKVVVSAAALATAFIADADPPNPATQPQYDGFGATLHALLTAASALSAFLEDGHVTVHAVEIEGGVAAAGAKLTLRVDYSVDVQVKAIDLGFMRIGMKPSVPMRLRYRNVRLLVDFAQSGLDRFHLSFGDADVDVEDPGGWQVESPTSLEDLFDVLTTRAGHGSQWFEIDLRFALDLGPVKVSGATVRATLADDGAILPEVRGLDASLNMPGLFEGGGRASLGAGELDLALTARIVPLGIAAFARVSYAACDGVTKLLFALGVDLPGPIPLANSGLGIYGLGGIFGVNAALPRPAPGADPVLSQLELEPMDASIYGCAPGSSVFGLGAVVGTVGDLGFTFSSRAVVVIGVPDVAVRASLDGTVFHERVSMSGTGATPGAGASFVGLLSISGEGVTIGMRGHYVVPHLVEVDVPFGAHFPNSRKDWYVRLGSDGQTGRPPGPIQTRILPDILNVRGWGYLMVHGDGINALGGDPAFSPTGFAIGFGAGFNATYGVPMINLELTASITAALGTRPMLLAGEGRLSGSLHLGPVSIGASAQIEFVIAPALGDRWVRFEVCGEVDLFFFSFGGCVTIDIGEHPSTVPLPTDWPLQSVALADHLYTKLADAVASPNRPPLERIPVVWPDVIPILEFTTGPANGLEPGPFTGTLAWNPSQVGSGVVGNDRLNTTYTLTSVALTAIDTATGEETPVTGPLDAAWQEPKSGSQPGARELALMTWETTLWTRKLVAGGAGNPHDPVPGVADRCRRHVSPRPSWALGVLAHRTAPTRAWMLPTEPPTDSLSSTFEVRVKALWWDVPLDDSTVRLLPITFPFMLPAPVRFKDQVVASAHHFGGMFHLPHVTGLPVDGDPDEFGALGEVPIEVFLTFTIPLHDPRLALRVPLWPPDGLDRRLEVWLLDSNQARTSFPMVGDEQIDSRSVVRSYSIGGGPWSGILIEHHASLAPAVLGVRGVTGRAIMAASDANAANQKAAQTAATKAQAVRPRPMLQPGKVYRLDVRLTGQARRESGPPGPVIAHTDRYWFRTPDPRGAAASRGLQYLQGEPDESALAHYHRFVAATALAMHSDSFDPVYLDRYVLSWMPSDGTRDWFLDDPVGVQLSVDHVAALAATYDHNTVLHVLRSDPTKGAPDPFNVQTFPAHTLWRAAISALLPESDRRLHALTSAAGCPYPSPGVTLGGRPELQPHSDYDVVLAFPFRDATGTGPSAGTHLRGGSFSTSRYRDPASLLDELGFAAEPSGRLGSHLPVDMIDVEAGTVVADGAIEQAMHGLGLGRRAVTYAARSSGLWTRSGGRWLLHGVLLEAPEPLHRPETLGLVNFGGRMLIDSLKWGGNVFERQVRSTSGDRVLFLTAVPLVAFNPLSLSVTMQEVPLESPTVAQTVAHECRGPTAPDFAADLP